MTTHEKTVTFAAGTAMSGAAVSGDLAVLTPNQVIAHNLHQARVMRGLTQEQAAERLEPYIGKRWSKASWSAAERSVTGERPREFTIDELIAFASCFELPPRWFMTPPAETREVELPGPATNLPREDYLAMLTAPIQHVVTLEAAVETDAAVALTATGGKAMASGGDVTATIGRGGATASGREVGGGELEDALREATERVIQLAGAVSASASMTRGTPTVDRHDEKGES
jgi:transcriptional regulator with XRE-family HTH domain